MEAQEAVLSGTELVFVFQLFTLSFFGYVYIYFVDLIVKCFLVMTIVTVAFVFSLFFKLRNMTHVSVNKKLMKQK